MDKNRIRHYLQEYIRAEIRSAFYTDQDVDSVIINNTEKYADEMLTKFILELEKLDSN